MAWAEAGALRAPTTLPWGEGGPVIWQEAVGAWQDGLLNIGWRPGATTVNTWIPGAATVSTWGEEAPLV